MLAPFLSQLSISPSSNSRLTLSPSPPPNPNSDPYSFSDQISFVITSCIFEWKYVFNLLYELENINTECAQKMVPIYALPSAR